MTEFQISFNQEGEKMQYRYQADNDIFAFNLISEILKKTDVTRLEITIKKIRFQQQSSSKEGGNEEITRPEEAIPQASSNSPKTIPPASIRGRPPRHIDKILNWIKGKDEFDLHDFLNSHSDLIIEDVNKAIAFLIAKNKILQLREFVFKVEA